MNKVIYDGEEIMLDKPRHIRFTMKGIKYLVKKYGSLSKAIDELGNVSNDITEQTLNVLTTFIYAGLIHEDKSLTEDDVDNIIDIKNIGGLSGKIMLAMSNSLPDSKEGNG